MSDRTVVDLKRDYVQLATDALTFANQLKQRAIADGDEASVWAAHVEAQRAFLAVLTIEADMDRLLSRIVDGDDLDKVLRRLQELSEELTSRGGEGAL